MGGYQLASLSKLLQSGSIFSFILLTISLLSTRIFKIQKH